MAMNTGYIVGFAAAVCVVCSLGVAGASMGLRPLQEANELNAFQKNILSAVDLPPPNEDGVRPALSREEVQTMFDERLKLIVVDREGNEVFEDLDNEAKKAKVAEARAKVKGTRESPEYSPVYLRVKGDKTEAYAIELQGKGLWGPISGYIALKPNGKEIMSVAFDAPKETPGLGAEIMKDKFKEQWEGKMIADASGLTPVDVPKSCAGKPAEHCVDGVSGATITSRGVDEMVERAVNVEYASYLKKIQAGG